MITNWDPFRINGQELDLVAAFDEHFAMAKKCGPAFLRGDEKARAYLRTVMDISPIQSRQVAALALAHAKELAWPRFTS